MIDIQTVPRGRSMHPLCRAAIAGIQTRGDTRIRWSAGGLIIVKPMISQWSSYATADVC